MDDCYHITCYKCRWNFSIDDSSGVEGWFCPECGAPQTLELDFGYCDDCQQTIKLETLDYFVSCPVCEMNSKKSVSLCPVCLEEDLNTDLPINTTCPECLALFFFHPDGKQLNKELVYENEDIKLFDTNAYYIAESNDVSKYFYVESKVFLFHDSMGMKTSLASNKWNRGHGDVKAFATEGPNQIRNICGGLSADGIPQGVLSLGVHNWRAGEAYLELRQGKIKPDSNLRSSTFRCTLNQLNDASGVNVADVLREFGAVQIATRQKLFNDTTSRKLDLCVTFNSDNEKLPVIAFILTRLLPLYHKVYAI